MSIMEVAVLFGIIVFITFFIYVIYIVNKVVLKPLNNAIRQEKKLVATHVDEAKTELEAHKVESRIEVKSEETGGLNVDKLRNLRR